jgi:putative transposase
VRYVWNWALATRSKAYKERKESVGFAQLCQGLTELKKDPETEWPSEVSAVPLQQTLRHQEQAFRNFFAQRAGYPTFKKRHNRQSATYVSTAFSWKDGQLKLAKMKEPLDIRWSRGFVGIPTTVIVTQDPAERYFISMRVEETVEKKPINPHMVGIDLGLNDLVVLSTGEKVGHPRFFRKDEKRLATAQRRLSKKKRGSMNRAKARKKVARIHARMADKRQDFLHQLTSRIIDENQVVCAESLRVKNRVKNRHLAKSISDSGWDELVRQLAYKAEWYGRTFIQDTFFPSTKTCRDCNHVIDALPLHMRSWTCPRCDAIHDRDVNAANTVLAAGLAVSACGEAVRPMRA